MLKQKQNGKFDETGSQGIFLEYGETHRSYRIMDPGTGNVEFTHHVKFLPTKFPSFDPNSLITNQNSFLLVPNETETVPVVKDISPTTIQETNPCESEENLQADIPPLDEEDTSIQPELPTYKGYLWVPEHESVPQNKIHGDVGNPRDILPYQRQSGHHANLADHFSSDPKTYQEAMNGSNSQEWKNAIKVELDNMRNHKVWSPTMPENHVKPLSTTCKTDKNGNLSKFKARLCVQGFTQKEGIDYSEVFSPTGRLASLQLLLTLFHIHQYLIEQMDVQCAFLNGKPEETLHIYRPSGYSDHPETHVCVLNKSL
ncbi:hypothetical protein O181_019906 [Austropuccinia psidii MF-1]|uniref:Reverse transcriptase Ty1/copia-type domain-containing protein n=1 Tax=Austropuccinia psidii MF-1 TaxID=1389203 RepID=A0A9Q3GUC0_9BASI|nr:hypothetical protein [Austropuccinia psidii MF-1]